ncbi:TetR/AcrR family transcriptional regulator [Streptomyces sp. NPDC050546]|uniref:TetR/AcrR family transcriptional regulator n=1 Tax=Streptomyces sp. NPDC050546 TaxID=3365628 RepID=UPI0037A63F9C
MNEADVTGLDTPQQVARVRNRRGEGGRLREDIIDAASALLDETGDERAITLRSVARRIGIAAPSIYRHFPDQPAIMLAVVEREFAALADHLREAAQHAGDDPRERLHALGRAYLRYAQDHPGRYRTMFGGLWMPTLGDNSLTEEQLTGLGAPALRILADALADCAAAGQSTVTDPELDAVTLWISMHGLAHQYAVIRIFPWPAESVADAIIARVAKLTSR